MNYYFTYGLAEHYPFRGGWTKVVADSRENAVRLFQIAHPDKNENMINCYFIYDEEGFKETEMFQTNDNLGHGCQEILMLIKIVADNKE